MLETLSVKESFWMLNMLVLKILGIERNLFNECRVLGPSRPSAEMLEAAARLTEAGSTLR